MAQLFSAYKQRISGCPHRYTLSEKLIKIPRAVLQSFFKTIVLLVSCLSLLIVGWLVLGLAYDKFLRSDSHTLLLGDFVVVPPEENLALRLLELKKMSNEKADLCWKHGYEDFGEECLKQNGVEHLLNSNEKTIEEFRQLHRFSNYQNLTGQLFNETIALTDLSNLEILRDLHFGRTELAYQKWKAQMSLSRKLLVGSESFVSKVVSYLVFTKTMELLEAILLFDPALAEKHQSELLALLRGASIPAVNMKDMYVVEYLIWRDSFELEDENQKFSSYFKLAQKNRVLNVISGHAAKHREALSLPGPEARNAVRALSSVQYSSTNNWIVDPFGSALLFDGSFERWHLEQPLFAVEARLRFAAVYVLVIAESVKDKDVSNFIHQLGSRYEDPTESARIQWDSTQRSVFLEDIERKCRWQNFHLPRPIQTTDSLGNPNPC